MQAGDRRGASRDIAVLRNYRPRASALQRRTLPLKSSKLHGRLPMIWVLAFSGRSWPRTRPPIRGPGSISRIGIAPSMHETPQRHCGELPSFFPVSRNDSSRGLCPAGADFCGTRPGARTRSARTFVSGDPATTPYEASAPRRLAAAGLRHLNRRRPRRSRDRRPRRSRGR
jgi:hypothetical protein